MILFSALHCSLLLAIAIIAISLCYLCRTHHGSKKMIRLVFGFGLLINELGWWYFRYSHEGLRISNLPLQLCDLSVWATILACLFMQPLLIEFAYFAGIAGAGMALLTPDLWSPWPSYPAICFFVSHGGIVIANIVLVYGRITTLRPGAVWRAFGILVTLAAAIGAFNVIFKTNYMYLRNKPNSASLLDAFGPWPVYLVVAFALSLVLYLLLWVPVLRLKLKSESA